MIKEHYENQNEIKHTEEPSGSHLKNDYDFCLTENDFYPPTDNRNYKSLIYDIDEENNFVEYANYIFDLYDEEGYFEN